MAFAVRKADSFSETSGKNLKYSVIKSMAKDPSSVSSISNYGSNIAVPNILICTVSAD
jgi:hypothetical protein